MVLILALILLVVISTVAVLAVRNAMSGEQVSNNLRASAVATQNAEVGLRYCEQQVLAGAYTKVQPIPDGQTTPVLWQTRANWTTLTTTTVPDSVTKSSDSAGRAMAVAPTCMVEQLILVNLNDSSSISNYVITARGFSQDYATGSGGSVTSGGEVWMQSILRY